MSKDSFRDKPFRETIRHKYLFHFPTELRKRAKMICVRRDIFLAKFMREAVEAHINKYEKMGG